MYPVASCGQYSYPVNPECYPCPPIAAPQTCNFWYEESLPTFREMFLQSCQCPSHHKIYTMFHGTTYAAAKEIIKHGFKPSKDGMLGKGVYVSRDINKAMKYPQGHHSRKVVLHLRVNVGKVKKIDRLNHPLQKTWHDHGYSTAWVPPHCGVNPSGQEEDCVYNPKRIRVIDVACGDPCDMYKLRRKLFPC